MDLRSKPCHHDEGVIKTYRKRPLPLPNWGNAAIASRDNCLVIAATTFTTKGHRTGIDPQPPFNSLDSGQPAPAMALTSQPAPKWRFSRRARPISGYRLR